MSTDPKHGWLRNTSEPPSLREPSDTKRERDVALLESLVVTTTLAEAFGHPDISKILASACVRLAQKIGEPPPVDLISGDADR